VTVPEAPPRKSTADMCTVSFLSSIPKSNNLPRPPHTGTALPPHTGAAPPHEARQSLLSSFHLPRWHLARRSPAAEAPPACSCCPLRDGSVGGCPGRRAAVKSPCGGRPAARSTAPRRSGPSFAQEELTSLQLPADADTCIEVGRHAVAGHRCHER
jgi:hypothetical protein